MSYSDTRISGNSAYIIGTIAENEIGILRIIELLNSKTHAESKNILSYLIQMLQSDDDECLMNAAGTIGTIVRKILIFFIIFSLKIKNFLIY
jgi:hypothetical protein